MSAHRLSAHGLVIDLPGRAAGQPLDVTVMAGQVWGVLGPNGAGKTTLLHTLAGLRGARAGQVRLLDQPLAGLSARERARERAMVLQDYPDHFPATVLETVLVGRHPWIRFWQAESVADHRLARAALERVGLTGFEDREVTTLSGGERRRVAIAAAWAQAPQVYLLDEPTNHLDLGHQIAILTEVRREVEADDKAAVISLHDLNLCARFCDHAILMFKDGALMTGPVGDVLSVKSLSDLFDYPLRQLQTPESRLFVPD